MLRWIEGFEALSDPTSGTAMGSTDLIEKYPVNNISGTYYKPGRWGIATEDVYAWYADSGAYFETPALGDNDGWVVGQARNWDAASSHNFLECYDGATLQLALRLNVGGTVSVLRGTTVLGTTVNGIGTGAYEYIEFKFTANNTTGSYEVRFDGVDELSATDVDTQEGSNANVDRFRFLQTGPCYLDDIYILDQTGGQTDFLALNDGHGLVTEEVAPNADGYWSNWTSSLASDWQAVMSQSKTAQDSHHLRSSEFGDKVSLGMTNPDISQSHVGVQMNIRCRNLNASDEHQIAAMWRYNNNDTFLTDQVGKLTWATTVFRDVAACAELGSFYVHQAEMGFRLEAH